MYSGHAYNLLIPIQYIAWPRLLHSSICSLSCLQHGLTPSFNTCKSHPNSYISTVIAPSTLPLPVQFLLNSLLPNSYFLFNVPIACIAITILLSNVNIPSILETHCAMHVCVQAERYNYMPRAFKISPEA